MTRLRLVGVVLTATLTPGLLAYAGLLVKARASYTARLASGTFGDTPTPPPSSGFPDPAYVLVYFDPTAAGTLFLWCAVGAVAVAALVLIAAVWWPREPSPRGLLTLRMLSLGVGTVSAWPWIKALFH